jgi:hypothetical protein
MVLKALKNIDQLTPEQRQHFVTLNDEILHSYWSNNALEELSSGKISLVHSIPKFYSFYCSSNSVLFDFLLIQAKKKLLFSIQVDIIGQSNKDSSEADRTNFDLNVSEMFTSLEKHHLLSKESFVLQKVLEIGKNQSYKDK